MAPGFALYLWLIHRKEHANKHSYCFLQAALTALERNSQCSFTLCKLRLLVPFRLVTFHLKKRLRALTYIRNRGTCSIGASLFPFRGMHIQEDNFKVLQIVEEAA